ncbi:MAG: hypothetical protein ACRDNE_11305 [Gaiellaceae bacterium]
MFWRRPQPSPDLPLSRDDVLAIFVALADIKAWTRDILKILEGEENDGEEEAEP